MYTIYFRASLKGVKENPGDAVLHGAKAGTPLTEIGGNAPRESTQPAFHIMLTLRPNWLHVYIWVPCWQRDEGVITGIMHPFTYSSRPIEDAKCSNKSHWLAQGLYIKYAIMDPKDQIREANPLCYPPNSPLRFRSLDYTLKTCCHLFWHRALTSDDVRTIFGGRMTSYDITIYTCKLNVVSILKLSSPIIIWICINQTFSKHQPFLAFHYQFADKKDYQ